MRLRRRPEPLPEAWPHVVIVGGGFAGLNAARALAGRPVRVTLIDRRNYHLFQPLLYQVATAALSPAEIATPIRSVLRRQRNARVLLAEATAIDLENKRLVLDDAELTYDFLILAVGASHSYFSHPEWEEHAPGLKSIEDALEIRRRLLLAYENAEKETDEARRQALLTFVIVGAGPTGVEMAGAMSEIARLTLRDDFREIDLEKTRIILAEAGPRILPTFDAALASKAEHALRRLGVEVFTSSPVTDITLEGVRLVEDFMPARTVVWAAGVKASALALTLGLELDRAGRVPVAADLSLSSRRPFTPAQESLFTAVDTAGRREHDSDGSAGAAEGRRKVGTWDVPDLILYSLPDACSDRFPIYSSYYQILAMTGAERFIFDLRNALTPLKASVSLLARDWDSLGEAERKDLARVADEQMRVIDELLTRESTRREEEGRDP